MSKKISIAIDAMGGDNSPDKTVEGIKINDKNAFSVQYHPESSPGPHDSRYLFDHFINLIQEQKK